MRRETFPVSCKFYAEITARINSSLSSLPDSALEALRLVNCHLHGEATVSNDAMAMLAYNMIRPEIDRAMERSRRARESAARRKSAITITTTSLSKGDEKQDCAQPSQPSMRLNRRQRREMERIKKKVEAAAIRKLRGTYSGGSATSARP